MTTLELLDLAIKELQDADKMGHLGTMWCHDSHRVEAINLLIQARAELVPVMVTGTVR